MPSMVLISTKQPLFVISEQCHHTTLRGKPKIQDPLDTSVGIGATIYVVTEKDNGVLRSELRRNPTQYIVQRGQVAMDITDRNRAHLFSHLATATSLDHRTGSNIDRDDLTQVTRKQ